MQMSSNNEFRLLYGHIMSLGYCCRRQHTILNMKYCVYVYPVSLAELCIAERQLDFICNVRMFGCVDVWMIRFMTYFDVTEILQCLRGCLHDGTWDDF
jgi:hypothetical protein